MTPPPSLTAREAVRSILADPTKQDANSVKALCLCISLLHISQLGLVSGFKIPNDTIEPEWISKTHELTQVTNVNFSEIARATLLTLLVVRDSKPLNATLADMAYPANVESMYPLIHPVQSDVYKKELDEGVNKIMNIRSPPPMRQDSLWQCRGTLERLVPPK